MASENLGIVVGPDERRAIYILGKHNVRLASEVARAWNTGLPKHLTVPFSDEILRQCTKENEEFSDDQWACWELIYLIGILKNVEPGYRLIRLGTSRENLTQDCIHLTREESLEAAITFCLVTGDDSPIADIIHGWPEEFVIARKPDLIAL